MYTKEAAAKSEYNAPREDLFCKYCGKQCKNMNSLNNHQYRCKENPDRSEFYSGFVKYMDDVRSGKRKHKSWNKGLTKDTSESVRKYGEANSHKKTELEIKLDDDNKLYNKWLRKKGNAKHVQNIPFDLTFDQFCQLLDQAGIVSSQLGISLDSYVLGRYNDEGAYTWGNCRFITQAENVDERNRKHSWKEYNPNHSCSLGKQNKRVISRERRLQIESEKARINELHELIESKRKEREAKEFENVERMKRSPRFGSFWITDGTINKIWNESKGPIPHSFYRGKIEKKRVDCKSNAEGGFWITDGIITKLWRPEYGEIPEGFIKGKINKQTK